jgi:hypothetical protein
MKYCIQQLDDEGQTMYSFVTSAMTYTDDLDEALKFSSKLAAMTWIETNHLQAQPWAVVKVDQIVVKPKKFEPPFYLVIADPLEAVSKVVELHDFYCNRIEAWLRYNGIDIKKPRPTPHMTITSPTWAGLYSSTTHACHYPVVYAMMNADFNKIVAHETVHAYQRIFTGMPAGHGADFYAMMQHAAKEPVTKHTHDYDVKEAARLSEKLHPWWMLAKERGLLASLPCEVLTTKTKRKGVR